MRNYAIKSDLPISETASEVVGSLSLTITCRTLSVSNIVTPAYMMILYQTIEISRLFVCILKCKVVMDVCVRQKCVCRRFSFKNCPSRYTTNHTRKGRSPCERAPTGWPVAIRRPGHWASTVHILIIIRPSTNRGCLRILTNDPLGFPFFPAMNLSRHH